MGTLSSESTNRLPELDGVRGLAILLVLIWHCINYYTPDEDSIGAAFVGFFRLSWSGVDLFFVLSGFLIGGILIDNRRSSNYWRTFYLRRMCRIFPLYFLLFLIFLILVRTGPDRLDWLLKDPLPAFSYATFTQNFVMADVNTYGANFMGPTWSLAVEEQFYLLLPIIIFLCSPKRLPYVLVLLIICAPLARFIVFHWFFANHFLAAGVLMPCKADALLLGVLCAWAIRQGRILQAIKEKRLLLYLVFAFFLISTYIFGYALGRYETRGMVFFGGSSIAALYSSLLLIAVSYERSAIKYLLSNTHLRKLGEIAYGVYLLHLPIIGLAFGLVLNQSPRIKTLGELAVVLFALWLTIVTAQASWRFLEKPIVQFGHRFAYGNGERLRGSIRGGQVGG